eukprot:2602310-Prymnesium_polylepis.2
MRWERCKLVRSSGRSSSHTVLYCCSGSHLYRAGSSNNVRPSSSSAGGRVGAGRSSASLCTDQLSPASAMASPDALS